MERIQNLMKRLGISEAEAKDLLEDDKAIDKGEKLFELTADQKQVAKAMSSAGGRPHKTHAKREVKMDKDKAEIMQTIDDALCCLVDDVQERTNDRELVFIYNEKKYKVTLSCPRK